MSEFLIISECMHKTSAYEVPRYKNRIKGFAKAEFATV